MVHLLLASAFCPVIMNDVGITVTFICYTLTHFLIKTMDKYQMKLFFFVLLKINCRTGVLVRIAFLMGWFKQVHIALEQK